MRSLSLLASRTVVLDSQESLCCVLEQDTITRDHLYMTENFLTETKSINKLNMQVQLLSGARSLNFGLSLHLHPYFVFRKVKLGELTIPP